MKKILFVNGCVRPDSRTQLLAQHVLKKLEGQIEEINLEREQISPLNEETLQRRNAFVDAGDYSADLFRYARQFAEADIIVVAAPYWDLSFPAMVKNYFEAVTVLGLTFRYTPEGQPEGLCRAKKLIYVMTAGGSVGEVNLGYDYVKALCKIFYGIPETCCYKAELLDVIGADVEAILATARAEIEGGRF